MRQLSRTTVTLTVAVQDTVFSRQMPCRGTTPVVRSVVKGGRFQPNFATSPSGCKWVYRLSIVRLLWPVMEATSNGCNPFSNKRDAAS